MRPLVWGSDPMWFVSLQEEKESLGCARTEKSAQRVTQRGPRARERPVEKANHDTLVLDF